MIATWLALAATAAEPPPRGSVDWLGALPAGPDWAGLWPLGLAAIGAGLVLLARRRRQKARPDLTIVSRTSVSSQSALLLVDVRDPAGREHRLLVGTGGGPPSLVADLGVAEEELDEEPLVYGGRPALVEMPTRPSFRTRTDPDEVRPNRKVEAQRLISEVVEERRVAMVRP